MVRLLWIQALCCGGETVSLLNAEQPDLLTTFDLLGVDLVWHPAFSKMQGEDAMELMRQCITGVKKLDILVIEGALPTANSGVSSLTLMTQHETCRTVTELANASKHVMAVGTCASFGGVMCKGEKSDGFTVLQFHNQQAGGLLGPDFRSKSGISVVNVPGCPAHPDWITGTLTMLVKDELAAERLDRYNRPKMFFSKLAHHGCPRNEYYEFKASAFRYSQQGCLFEYLGCKGTQCDSDCNERLWLSRTGSCPRGGFPCLSCTSPNWPDGFLPFFETEKIGDVPTTLPLDVPKAWYVGISGLAKLACPRRLSENAVRHHYTPINEEERS